MKVREKYITNLFHLMTILAAASGLVIMALATFGIHRVFSHQVISMAESEAILVGQLLVENQHDALFARDDSGTLYLRVEPDYESSLHAQLDSFLEPLNIVKIKIFSPDARVVFSTDHAIIGQTNPENPALMQALSGKNVSHLETTENLSDLREETSFKVDVVETYTPIIVDGKILGVFELYLDVTRFRSDIQSGTQKSLVMFAAILGLVYLVAFSITRICKRQVAEAEAHLHKLATTDMLTGIFNRGELLTRAEEELARIARPNPDGSRSTLSLILLDIDHFKQVNDTYGHLAGDAILRQLPDRIRQGLRLYDMIGRYGGEEFLLLLPNTDLAGACTVAESIRCKVADQPFLVDDESLAIHISLGVATISAGTNLTKAIELADQALYQAKQKGRNRVESWSS